MNIFMIIGIVSYALSIVCAIIAIPVKEKIAYKLLSCCIILTALAVLCAICYTISERVI